MDEKVDPYPLIWADATMRPHQPGKTRLSPSTVMNGAVGLPTPVLMIIPEEGDTISALTRRAKETASHDALRWDCKTIQIKAWPGASHYGIRQRIRFV